MIAADDYNRCAACDHINAEHHADGGPCGAFDKGEDGLMRACDCPRFTPRTTSDQPAGDK